MQDDSCFRTSCENLEDYQNQPRAAKVKKVFITILTYFSTQCLRFWTLNLRESTAKKNLFSDAYQLRLKRRQTTTPKPKMLQKLSHTINRSSIIYSKDKLSQRKCFLSQLRWTKSRLNTSEHSSIPSQSSLLKSTIRRETMRTL